jgi:DNA-binding GntR family transcriptional regulator
VPVLAGAVDRRDPDLSTQVRKHELVYAAVRERIINGEYAPGSRLVIPRLARDFGVSALPVREALRRLEAEGLVSFEHNVGARVGMASTDEWESAMHVLSLLEGYATALSAEHLSDEDVAALRDINASLADALERSDIGSAKDLNRQFHVRVYERCPNDYLMSLVRLGWNRLDSLRGWDVYHLLIRGQHLVQEHTRLLDMIEAKAPAAEIEAFARDHKLRTVEVYRQNRDVLRMIPGGLES